MPRAAVTLPAAFPAARFRALDGHTELAVAEAASGSGARPARVTALIAAICDDIGGVRADRATVRRISAAGREWLLQRAALRFFDGQDWFEAPCPACGAKFDMQVSLRDIPRAAPGAGFPVAEVETSLGLRRFEAPNGSHEEAFARRAAEDPRRVFAALCGLSEAAEAEAIRFDAQDLARIDAALETTSPEIADGVDVACPDCHAGTRARIDPLAFAFPRVTDVLREVHLIASAYHWPEAAILDLPLPRRRAYANLIRIGRPGAVGGGRRMS